MSRVLAQRWVQPESLRDRRILIVEDEYHLADDMALDFEGLGAVVVGPVPSVAEGLELLDRGEAIDGAVLDINLRGEMVFPLAEALERRGVPFIFSTGYERRSIPASYASVAVCQKPVDAVDIARTLFG